MRSLPLLLLLGLVFAAGCGRGTAPTTPSPAPTSQDASGLRKTIDDAVDATITHKSQIEAFQRTKKKLKALDAKNRQMMQDLEGME